jgi:hypothetical protein
MERTYKNNSELDIDLAKFGAGIYFVRLNCEDKVYTNKIIVK